MRPTTRQRRQRHRLPFCLLLASAWASTLAPASPAADAPPRSLDPAVVIERFAGNPDVVTPTGLTVDGKGRVLVVESHTHFRPKNYNGPPADRIRVLEDRDGDGRAE